MWLLQEGHVYVLHRQFAQLLEALNKQPHMTMIEATTGTFFDYAP